MSLETEAHLIARCRQGDGGAWDRLFDLHYGAAGRFVFQLSPGLSREDVEEICQETFLAVIKNIHSFKGGSRLQTWVFRIAANKARDYRQRQQAAKRGGGMRAGFPARRQSRNRPAARSAQPLARPGRASRCRPNAARRWPSRWKQLGLPCREIIELRYFADLSYDEIGAELNLERQNRQFAPEQMPRPPGENYEQNALRTGNRRVFPSNPLCRRRIQNKKMEDLLQGLRQKAPGGGRSAFRTGAPRSLAPPGGGPPHPAANPPSRRRPAGDFPWPAGCVWLWPDRSRCW